MNMREAFDRNQAEIAQRVSEAAERIDLPSKAGLSLATWMRVRDNHSVSIYQPAGMVTLDPSQAVELMNRIAVDVLKTQAETVLS